MEIKTWRWRLVLAGLLSVALVTLGLLMADRAGVSRSVINGFFLIISIVGYATIGMVCRTTTEDEYYVAGRRVPAPFNGMATAADWMSAASFLGVVGLLLSDGFMGDGCSPGGVAYILGWTGGFCLLGVLFAGKLNASKAITLPQFLSERFNSPAVRWVAAWGAILCSSIYLVAQIYGIGLVASMLSGLTFELGVFLALGGVLLCSFLGGMRAVTWTQVVQCVVIVASMWALAVAVSWAKQGHPVVALAAAQSMESVMQRAKQVEADPKEQATRELIRQRVAELDVKIADPMRALSLEREGVAHQIARAKAENLPAREIQRLESLPSWRANSPDTLVHLWRTERQQLTQAINHPVGFQAPNGQVTPQGWWNTLALIFCLMVGTAALPHILVRSYTTVSPQEAKKSIAWALFFVVAVYVCASALAVLIKSFVLTDLVGAQVDQLPAWAERLRGRKLGLLNITDYNQDGIVQFADIRLLSDYLVLVVPEMVHISPVFTGLIAAGALAAALSTADGLLLTISNALAQDLYFETAAPSASSVNRVMLSKILLMVVALFAAWFATNRPVDILFWVTCAFSLAAATFFPVLCLSLYWSGMSRAGALLAMLCGMTTSALYIVINHPWIQSYWGLPVGGMQWWGIDPVCAGAFGVPVGLLAGWMGGLVWPDQKSL